jgi:hypothetical protein
VIHPISSVGVGSSLCRNMLKYISGVPIPRRGQVVHRNQAFQITSSCTSFHPYVCVSTAATFEWPALNGPIATLFKWNLQPKSEGWGILSDEMGLYRGLLCIVPPPNRGNLDAFKSPCEHLVTSLNTVADVRSVSCECVQQVAMS